MFSGQRLKEIREAQGMSQASVAKHLGISRSSYFNWENGKTGITSRLTLSASTIRLVYSTHSSGKISAIIGSKRVHQPIS